MNTTPTGGGNRAQRPDDLDQFVAAARVDEAVRDRRRRHHLASRALEEADTARTLLAAIDRAVTVHVAGASPVRGSVFSVGEDVVELRTPTTDWWIALRAVGAVETDGALLGDPADRATTSLADLACDLVDSGAPVTVMLSSGASLHGEVAAVGAAMVLAMSHPVRSAVVEFDHLVAITRRAPRS